MLKLLLFSQLWHAFPDLLIAASMFQIMLSCFGLFSGAFEGNKNLTSDFAQVNKKIWQMFPICMEPMALYIFSK